MLTLCIYQAIMIDAICHRLTCKPVVIVEQVKIFAIYQRVCYLLTGHYLMPISSLM